MKRSMNSCSIALAAAVISCWMAAPARSQGLGRMVDGNGTATIECLPQSLRMQVDVSAKGKTLTEALDTLKKQREAAAKKLESLGAEKATIKSNPPAIGIDPIEMQMRMGRTRNYNQPVLTPTVTTGKTPPAAASVLVHGRMTADWRLKGANAEQLLLEINELKSKVDAADLGGQKNAKPLTPEEQELAEELVQNRGGDPSAAQPGAATYTTLVTLTAEQRDKALAEAFAKAKSQASVVAKAAGRTLGELQTLTSSSGGVGGYDLTERYMRQRMGDYSNDDVPTEVSDGEYSFAPAGSCSIRLTVRAAFDLSPARPTAP